MTANQLDPRVTMTSLGDLCDKLGAPIALCSSPEFQLNKKNAMKTAEQITEKLHEPYANKVISIVDFMGSTSGVWTGSKIRAGEDGGKTVLHQNDFERDLSRTEEFKQYLSEHHDSFVETAGGNNEKKVHALATKGFAIKNSQWNSYWRGKVAGGLTTALSMMQPKAVSAQVLNSCGIGALINFDLNKTHVAIAAVIDGGPVTQEEQREITQMVDEVVFDLRRRGPSWAMSAAILIVRFPDIESFVRSLGGEKNLIRATADRFPTRQRDECKFQNVIYTMGLAWEVRDGVKPQGTGKSLLRVSVDEALSTKDDADPSILLQIAKTGDTVGVNRLLSAKCDVKQAKTRVNFSALHACAYGGFADTASAILTAHCTQEYLDSMKTPENITPLFFAAQFGALDVCKLLLERGANVKLGRDDGQSPLYKAAHKGHKQIVELMMKYGADISVTPKDGSTPLFIASQHGHEPVVECLMHAKADPDKPMNGGATPLVVSSQNGHQGVVTILAKSGANLNAVNSTGQTSLHKAAQKGFSEIAQILLKAKADTNVKAKDGKTPLELAQANSAQNVVQLLQGN